MTNDPPPPPSIIARIPKFARNVWETRFFIFRSPVDWHNLRASWHQSDPYWLDRLPVIFESDGDMEEWLKALDKEWPPCTD